MSTRDNHRNVPAHIGTPATSGHHVASWPVLNPSSLSGDGACDGPAWISAASAWRRWHDSGFTDAPPGGRPARVRLVNEVIAAVRRHERGITSEEAVSRVLHEAVESFRQRLASMRWLRE